MMFRRGPRTNSKFQSKLLESKPKELISPVMPYSFKTAMLRDPVPDTAGHSLRTFPHQAIRPNKSRDHILDDQDVVMTTFHQRKISNKIHLNDLQRRQIRKIRQNRHPLSSRQCNSIYAISIPFPARYIVVQPGDVPAASVGSSQTTSVSQQAGMECPGRTEQRYVNDPESPKIP
jgi:hypothetical protein